MKRSLLVLSFGLAPAVLTAQAATLPESAARVAPPPATKLEAFQPKAGSIVLLGYDELGRVGSVSVDVRELRQMNGAAVRGMVVDVRESQYRQETAFVDGEEIPELLKGIDALVAVTKNPTQFQNFEVRYSTNGKLELVAFNNSAGKISFAVKAGRLTTASAYGLSAGDLGKLRDMFSQAQTKLASSGQE